MLNFLMNVNHYNIFIFTQVQKSVSTFILYRRKINHDYQLLLYLSSINLFLKCHVYHLNLAKLIMHLKSHYKILTEIVSCKHNNFKLTHSVKE